MAASIENVWNRWRVAKIFQQIIFLNVAIFSLTKQKFFTIFIDDSGLNTANPYAQFRSLHKEEQKWDCYKEAGKSSINTLMNKALEGKFSQILE